MFAPQVALLSDVTVGGALRHCRIVGPLGDSWIISGADRNRPAYR
jgi:hypothetical protein